MSVENTQVFNIATPEDDGDTLEGHVLHTLFDSYIAEDNWLWCSVDDYWKALDTEIEVK